MRLVLPEAVAHHAIRVLRLSPGAVLTLFDGFGGEYPARIEDVQPGLVRARLGAWRDVERESPLRVTLVQVLQAADKMDFTLQKAVELGVHAIFPVAGRRSVLKLSGDRMAKRLAHWRAILHAACAQCGRNRVPELGVVMPLETWLAGAGRAVSGLKLMLLPEAARPLNQQPPADCRVHLLIGAEGGLAPEEIDAARQAGFLPTRLGPRTLRTETAALAALTALQTLWGDFRDSGSP
jgi:16S rRNA (uracil1498-N3)-methyltransferase